jgi:hypothetical protein
MKIAKLKVKDRSIKVEERLEDLQIIYLKCLEIIKKDGYEKETNQYPVMTPSAKMFLAISDRIMRLERQESKSVEQSLERDKAARAHAFLATLPETEYFDKL